MSATKVAESVCSIECYRRLRLLLVSSRPDVAHFRNTSPLSSPTADRAFQRLDALVLQRLPDYRLLCPVVTLFRDGRVRTDCVGRVPSWPRVWHAWCHRSLGCIAIVATTLAVLRSLATWKTQACLYVGPGELARRKLVEGRLPAGRIAMKPRVLRTRSMCLR
jgi:hypothetical protein